MAERREAERRDAALAGAPAGADLPPTAEQRVLRGDLKPKRRILNKVVYGLIALLILGIAGETRRQRAPVLEPDCTKPAFALSSPVRQGRPTAFTMVGPSGRQYVLGVNTASFVRDGSTWRPVPLLGKSGADVVVVESEDMPECRRTGVLNLAVPLGEHTVSMYELTDDQGAIEVQREPIVVIDPDDEDTAVVRES